MALAGGSQFADGAAPFPYPKAPSVVPAGHERPIPGSGVYPNQPTYPTTPTGGGFTGTPEQSATAAHVAGLAPNSPDWINAVTQANANGGVLPNPPAASPAPNPASPAPNPFDSDPGYAAAVAAETLGIAPIRGSLQNQIAQRLTQFGDASIAAQAGFGVDPQAAAFARQNYLTGNAELARLDHAHQLARQAIINRLAGRGLLFSGDTGYQTGQEDQRYGNQVYDAQQKLLNDLYGYQNNTLAQEQALHGAVQQALEHAFDNAANHPGLYGTGAPPTTTTKTPTTTKKVAAPTKNPPTGPAGPVGPDVFHSSKSAIVNQLRWQR